MTYLLQIHHDSDHSSEFVELKPLSLRATFISERILELHHIIYNNKRLWLYQAFFITFSSPFDNETGYLLGYVFN